VFLAELPDRLAGIAERWALRLGAPLPIGIGGYLVLVRTPEGGEAVLRLSPTGGEQDRANELEAWALGRWAGVGAVRLYRCDVSAGALLIERCLPGTSVDSLPDDEMVAAGCGLARRLHRQPDDEDHRVALDLVVDAGGSLVGVSREVPRSRVGRTRTSRRCAARVALFRQDRTRRVRRSRRARARVPTRLTPPAR
jgi:hypothetical protein